MPAMLLVFAGLLGGCAGGAPSLPTIDQLNPFKEEKKILPGKRISILPESDKIGGAELAAAAT
ncbi:MAG: hypothetical protein KKB37_13900, partial [Alphaproteobacteria bacterium]|nr:hypothetical protein [Alphaproteobacteria bacterium]